MERTDIETVYFTDSQGVLEGLKAALRLRRENGVSVCCFKMEKAVGRALSERLELSCEAPDIKSGAHDLALMPEMPESAKNTLLNGEFLPVCSCVFTRTHGVFEKDGLSFVLSYDTGELSKGESKGKHMRAGAGACFGRYLPYGKAGGRYMRKIRPFSLLSEQIPAGHGINGYR